MSGPDQPIPPVGYSYQGKLFADLHTRFPNNWVLLFWANLLALLPLSAGILLLWLPYQVYRLAGSPLARSPSLEWPTAVSVSVGTLIVVGSIIIHEALHLLALILLGHQPVLHLKYFSASVPKKEYLSRNAYLLVSLTPLVVMSLVGGLLLLLLPPAAADLLLIALLLNTAASIGDLVVALRVYRAPANALFADDGGICIFVPISGPLPTMKETHV